MSTSRFHPAVLVALLPVTAWSQAYTFTAIAGQPPRVGSTDGTGSAARFFYPQGTAIDQGGNIYVADTNNQIIRKISPAGVVTTIAGMAGERGMLDGPATAARFSLPHAITVDASGNVFVAGDDQTLRKITPGGVVSTLAGTAGRIGHADGTGSAASFNSPTGLVADPSGNLFVADSANFTIRKVTPNGVVTTYAGVSNFQGLADGPAATAKFAYPYAIALDRGGNLYVNSGAGAGDGSEIIRKITPAGIVSTLAGSNCGPSAGIRGLAIDSGGNLLISMSNYCLRRLTPAGVNTVFVGAEWQRGNENGIGTSARLRDTQGICIDPMGYLYLAGGLAPVILKIGAADAVTTFAGQPAATGSADGNGLAARFNRPTSITGDDQGNLFVGDVMNSTIRKISPQGEVTTFVGSPRTPANATATPYISGQEAWVGPTLALDSSGNLFAVSDPPRKIAAISPAKVVTTIGSTNALGTPVDGPAAVAKISPVANCVAADGAGNLFFTDGHALRKIARDGTMSTLAGSVTETGSANGAGSSARFRFPSGLAVDRNGNVVVSDGGNDLIRIVTPQGVVSTLAGSAGLSGNTDGTGAQARFSFPMGIAIDASGNVFVADNANSAIRKVSPAGVVTTLSGFAWDDYYYADGTGSRARFMEPTSLWVSPQGELYITDMDAQVVVKGVLDRIPTITTPPQSVSVLAGVRATLSVNATGGGLAYQWKFNGNAIDGATDATYTIPAVAAARAGSYTVDIRNSAGSVTSSPAVLTVIAVTLPSISAPPASASVFIGNTATFSVAASGGGLTYQWKFNGVPIAGATDLTYAIAAVSPPNAGDYAVQVGNSIGTVTSASAALVVTTPGRLTNLSVLTALASADDSFTVGMTAGGIGTIGAKPLLLRAMGPSLAGVGVQNPVQRTRLAAYSGAVRTDENNGWSGDAGIAAVSARVGAFAFASPTSADSALYVSDAAGPGRTLAISGAGPGIVLAEVYDATPAASYTLTTPRLINLSVLKTLTGGLTTGFGIVGNTSLKVLIRAVGPSLSGFGVSGAVARPKLEVFDAGGRSLATNAGWGGAPAASAGAISAGAFPLEPASLDAVLVLDLSPGTYTVVTTALDDATGLALVEIYELP